MAHLHEPESFNRRAMTRQITPQSLADVALVDGPTAAATGSMSISWWHTEVAGGRAPQPVIREPRCTRWLVAEVRAFWVARAQALLEELVGGVFLDADRLIPLARGMALAQERVRPRIPRGEADRIVRELVAAATAINARTGARVFVERLEVFGSYLSDRADLGDVDVIAIIPLPDDCIPEDMEERDEVSASLQVSDYVSLTDEFDHVAAGADKEVIFIRDPE